MADYLGLSDDYFVNATLSTEMDLPTNRESVLHFFEQFRKHFPTMKNFYAREPAEFVLEEEKEERRYRWIITEARRVVSGSVNPDTYDEGMDLHRLVLEMAPYALSASGLDCESLSLSIGFDFNFRGNHNQLLADALGVHPVFDKIIETPGIQLLGNEPILQFSFDGDCKTQFRLTTETRTNPFHVTTGEYPEEQLSIYLTGRRFGSLEPGDDLVTVLNELSTACQQILDNYIVEEILLPLQATIAIS